MAKAKNTSLKKAFDEFLLEGGLSYNILDASINPKTGYMVSILGFEKQFDVDDFTYNNFLDYLNDNILDLWGKTRYLGCAVIGDKVIMDVSVNIEDLEKACYTGIINKQDCMYDCANKKYIYLPYGQTAGTETQVKTYNLETSRKFAEDYLKQSLVTV
jgi:hypothetical protein